MKSSVTAVTSYVSISIEFQMILMYTFDRVTDNLNSTTFLLGFNIPFCLNPESHLTCICWRA